MQTDYSTVKGDVKDFNLWVPLTHGCYQLPPWKEALYPRYRIVSCTDSKGKAMKMPITNHTLTLIRLFIKIIQYHQELNSVDEGDGSCSLQLEKQ